MNVLNKISDKLEEYYATRKNKTGVSPESAGWRDETAQANRFTQLAKLINQKDDFSINDLGCGFGNFCDFLSKNGAMTFEYFGYDTSKDMIFNAKKLYGDKENHHFFKIAMANEMQKADYTVASGLLNLKFTIPEHEWIYYMLEIIHTMNEKSRKGFAFNALTKYSDKEYMRDELYYADPCFFFDYCKKNFSKNVALLHDYEEYDFTIIVRK